MHYHDIYLAEGSSPAASLFAPAGGVAASMNWEMHYHEARLADPIPDAPVQAVEGRGDGARHYHEAHLCDLNVVTSAAEDEAGDPALRATGHYHDAGISGVQTAWFGEVALNGGETYAEALAKEVSKLRSVYQEMAESYRRTANAASVAAVRAA